MASPAREYRLSNPEEPQCITLALTTEPPVEALPLVSGVNRHFLQLILQGQRQGRGCLPFQLGLAKAHFQALNAHIADSVPAYASDIAEPEEDLRQELLVLRQDEWLELRTLLLEHRNQQSLSEIWMAEIVAAACLGGDHLWRDLGLPNRAQLSDLLDSNFHSLTAKNDRDMKWKKFFYKQLCERGGGYLCRAPSCEACKSFHDCFGPED